MTTNNSAIRVVVVGNGMVGHHFVENLIKSGQPVHITVLSGEPRLAYDRVHLSSWFTGSRAEDLALTDELTYEQWGINYVLNAKVENIDRARKSVSTHQYTYDYDVLVLATGSYAYVPPIAGSYQPHCLVYRTIEDLQTIEHSATQSKVGVVVGGGLLGLEAANALKQAGLKTHVVEFAAQLMAVQLDEGAGTLLREKIEALGVTVHTQKATQVIESGQQCRYRMVFADDSFLETDMILFSAGIRPCDQLGREAGLAVGERGGIIINNQCQTNDPDIYAIGECALWENRTYGLVAPGYTMARTAVASISNKVLDFVGADMSTKLKLMGVEVGSIGDAHAKTAGAQCYTYQSQPQGVYKKLIVDAAHSKVLGAVLVGDTSDYDTLLQYCLNDMPLPKKPETLILPSSDEKPALGAEALPTTATICSCHNVAKSDIVEAIDNGCASLDEIKTCTKASSGCGGCSALLKNVVDSELEHRGVAVSKALCEHFDHTRQELFHLVKVEKIRSFDALIARHGTGLGCDICRPTVGSILASVWNDYVLNTRNVSLQDTNDTYLGNMQKDGTYSIVPRVPGGEITPAGLIVIGEVAQKFNLYTKITGGQRIDLFGARVDQLLDIWQILVSAGFETGHAYAKALRTVKSCVGSTWCRYGVQDSVGQAIALEHRYKGLRAPHKIKFAVSGCTRECAEAQSKDIGIIATENGWNLYVCGNGGMKPRHGDLFATDLSTDTLVKYIDRILMFYIKTADRLQRTSVWMDNLEGGLAYLQSVVIEDTLGINSELEVQMQRIVGAYQCEWKTTLASQDAKKRFRQFVNSKRADTNIQFVDERGQIRPATELEKALGQARIPVELV
ncbi:nitrite reductase large subunit NirB [Alteromonas lipotrueiana]|uniref:nitrite reductase large subunit NirB n=1 Tax=Alteromonas lipotrueiana TaxID=2803815 RepID=UPI001C47004E|nr:nitrite reductase large subunit NirB [Alteromonas lipotrueiana]